MDGQTDRWMYGERDRQTDAVTEIAFYGLMFLNKIYVQDTFPVLQLPDT